MKDKIKVFMSMLTEPEKDELKELLESESPEWVFQEWVAEIRKKRDPDLDDERYDEYAKTLDALGLPNDGVMDDGGMQHALEMRSRVGNAHPSTPQSEHDYNGLAFDLPRITTTKLPSELMGCSKEPYRGRS